jgi:DNA-binding GntR family transcriptional regulator
LVKAVKDAVAEALRDRISIAERTWLTTDQAAEYLGCSVERLREALPRWAAKWGVKIRRNGGRERGRILIARASLDRMVEQYWI